MSKFFNNPVVGIDVSADFSYAAILAPNGDVYKKSFRINHDVKGFTHLVNEIKKVEEEFNMKTGPFHGPLACTTYLFSTILKIILITFVINPLVTKSVTKMCHKKSENMIKDTLSIANIGKFQNIKLSVSHDLDIFLLKNLIREYYKLRDSCSTYKRNYLLI
ncbi:IS110 family transposase [Clostridium butyricum]